MTTPAVRVKNLTYTFAGRNQPTLCELNFELPAGSWTLVAGRTGSGKSTLLRALCGLIPHHTAGDMLGTVELFGRDTRETPPAQLARQVGLVLQSPDDQICTTTVSAEVAFGLENLALPPVEIGQRIDHSLRQFGLADLATAGTHRLSGGQKQRLMLASILAMQPPLLLLDEPLSQLDPQAAGEVLEHLDALRATGLTIVIVEHRLDHLLSRADRVLLLDNGRLVALTPTVETQQISDLFTTAGLQLPELAQLSLALGAGLPTTVPETVDAIRRRLPERAQAVSVVESAEQKRSTETPARLLRVHQLAHRYPDSARATWQQVSFDLVAGERVALVGSNGSGKSTLLSVLAGLLPATSGSIVWAPDSDDTSRTMPSLGFLLQQPDLMLFCRTVREELAFGPKQIGLEQETIDARVSEAADQLGLTHLLDQPPQSLSQGERLRTALAATLTLAPRLLLLDEPTTGQDLRNADALIRQIGRGDSLKPGGKKQPLPLDCVLFSTHDLRLVVQHANRVLVLADGRLAADCSPQALLADDALLAAAGLRRPPLYEVRHRLRLRGLTLAALLAELQP